MPGPKPFAWQCSSRAPEMQLPKPALRSPRSATGSRCSEAASTAKQPVHQRRTPEAQNKCTNGMTEKVSGDLVLGWALACPHRGLTKGISKLAHDTVSYCPHMLSTSGCTA